VVLCGGFGKMKVSVSRRFKFDAAHRLPGYKGPCSRLHGHSWRFEVCVSGPVKEDGMVVDFVKLKEVVQPLLERFDHHNLNRYFEMPTAENIGKFLFGSMDDAVRGMDSELKLEYVKVWESDDSFVTVKES